MKKGIEILEILVGLLALIIGIVTLYPLKFSNTQGIGGQIILLGVALLVVGIFRLASVFSYENLGLAKKVNVATSVLTIAAAVVILYFQIVVQGESWLHLLFGIGLLSYAVGRVTVGALTSEYKFGLRVFIIVIGIIIGVFSSVVILFQMVLIHSEGFLKVYLTYSYFTKITFVLIGVDCLASSIFVMFLSRQKQSP